MDQIHTFHQNNSLMREKVYICSEEIQHWISKPSFILSMSMSED